MILTEEEARTKWCFETTVFIAPESPQWPYAMLDSRGAPSTHPEFTRCIASECMAWRWAPAWKLENGHIHYTSNPVAGEKHLGYCGKGGKP